MSRDERSNQIAAESYLVGDVELVVFELPAETEAPAQFSESERCILRQLRAGRSSAEIAQARGTSARTVANQLASMYRKVNVSSRQELLAALAETARE